MSFGIFLSTEAAKFLKNLDKEDKNRIIDKLKCCLKMVHSVCLIRKSRVGKILIESGLEISG